jgi:hypothetical protein
MAEAFRLWSGRTLRQTPRPTRNPIHPSKLYSHVISSSSFLLEGFIADPILELAKESGSKTTNVLSSAIHIIQQSFSMKQDCKANQRVNLESVKRYEAVFTFATTISPIFGDAP